MRNQIAAVMIAVLALGGSVGPKPAGAQSTPAAPTSGGIPPLVWELMTVTAADDSMTTVDEPARYTVQFLSEGQLAGTADCNSIQGDYALDGNSLTIGPLLTTRVGCPAGSLGNDFTGWLAAVASYELEDDTLRLMLRDGGVLEFQASLVGVVWEWQTFTGGAGPVVSARSPARYTLTFEGDDSVLVQADCNRGRGTVVVDPPTISFSPIGLTRMACPEGSQAREFLAYLAEAGSFVIADGQLALALAMDGGIVTFKPMAEAAAATPAATAVNG